MSWTHDVYLVFENLSFALSFSHCIDTGVLFASLSTLFTHTQFNYFMYRIILIYNFHNYVNLERKSDYNPCVMSIQKELQRAVKAIRAAKALVFTSGAGMGVDSGLPDFRGPEGFWRAYPALKERGLRLESTSNPQWFERDPEFAWGFFGHRYNLYSQTTPHEGYHIILDWARQMENGYFAFTSNVDGHLQVISTGCNY